MAEAQGRCEHCGAQNIARSIFMRGDGDHVCRSCGRRTWAVVDLGTAMVEIASDAEFYFRRLIEYARPQRDTGRMWPSISTRESNSSWVRDGAARICGSCGDLVEQGADHRANRCAKCFAFDLLTSGDDVFVSCTTTGIFQGDTLQVVTRSREGDAAFAFQFPVGNVKG